MRFDVVTIFPEFVQALIGAGIMHGANERGIYELHTINPRDFTHDVHRSVDDRPYGGGPGMVMRPGPLHRAVKAAIKAGQDAQQAVQSAPEGTAATDAGSQRTRSRVIYMSPQGRQLNHELVQELSRESHLVLLAGRYEGIDERVIELTVDDEVSIGDYVLAGGELAAMVVIEACVRHLDGALGNAQSLVDESFAHGLSGLLDYEHYTRPAEYAGLKVPDILLGGDHRAIEHWRRERAQARTRARRPDLLDDKDAQ